MHLANTDGSPLQGTGPLQFELSATLARTPAFAGTDAVLTIGLHDIGGDGVPMAAGLVDPVFFRDNSLSIYLTRIEGQAHNCGIVLVADKETASFAFLVEPTPPGGSWECDYRMEVRDWVTMPESTQVSFLGQEQTIFFGGLPPHAVPAADIVSLIIIAVGIVLCALIPRKPSL